MPYIDRSDRNDLDTSIKSLVLDILSLENRAGTLNYVITQLLLLTYDSNGNVRYGTINEIVGILECAKLEFYRRLAAPYEDEKKKENGDVY